MKKIPLFTGILLSFLLAAPTHAAVFQHADTLSITLPVRNNLYAAGGTITVMEAVDGDVLIAGGNVRVQGSVGNTLQAAGGQVTVLGPVAKSARLAGGTVIVTSTIGGDLIVMGGQISVEPGAVIGGDLVMMGGTLTMGGVVKGAFKAYGGQVLLQGTVDGPVEMNTEDATVTGVVHGAATLAATRLVIGQGAAFDQNVRYWTEKGPVDFGAVFGAGGGTAVYDETLARTSESQAYQTAKGTGAAIAGLFGLYSLLSSAVLLLLLLLLWRPFLARAGDRLTHAPWQSLLTGFLYFAATPVLIVLLLVTLIGIPVGLFVLFLYIFSFVFGGAITAIVLARWIEIRYKKKWNLGIFFLVSVGVLFGLKLLAFVPVLGWIPRMIFLFMAVGALLLTQKEEWKRVSRP